MRTTKDFLKQECLNLREVLEETLRFKFGDDSKEFFEECLIRLDFVSDELDKLAVTNHSDLQKIAFLLVELSGLISRIERSSVGEYSWPFVEELKKIAVAICTEATLVDANSPPKIHVLSDGGLDKYAIYTESNRPSSAGKRILTIVFPRSLKHFVLLHSILGHEIGHAMWQCSKHQLALRDAIQQTLLSAGPLANPMSTSQWLYSANAPAEVKDNLAKLAPHGINQGTFFQWASWQAWVEEVLCDFIGLMTFGPSFLAAECNLLYSLDPAGSGIGQKHPPVACRVNYLLTGARLLGFDKDTFSTLGLQDAVRTYWAELRSKGKSDPWFDFFADNQVQRFCDALGALLGTLPPALYSPPVEADLKHLLDQLSETVPPTGFEIEDRQTMRCRPIDFRHNLYAGWIASITTPHLSFERVNRLCEHGIMQQRAIDIELSAS